MDIDFVLGVDRDWIGVSDMTLKELLSVMCKEDYVGIWDISYPINTKRKHKRQFEGQPTPQNYYKIKNIPYGKITYFLDKEVYAINHTEKGILIRIYNKGEAKKHLDMTYLAREIVREMKGGIK